MKLLSTRAAALAVVMMLALPLAAVGVASLPWSRERAATEPRVTSTARGSGSLRAGAAEIRFILPKDTPIAGFARLNYASEGIHGPVGARAIILEEPGCRIALVSAEILLVPESLDAEVAARVADLHLSGLVLAATHTHAGPGGYWKNALGERIATGPYDPRVRESIVAAIVQAIHEAAAELAPARLSTAWSAADDLARSRSGGLEDAPLVVMRLDRTDGEPLAELTIFAAHATLLGLHNRVISGDWPGRYLQGGAHGMRLLFQGAIGDQSTEGPSSGSPRGFANVLSSRVAQIQTGNADPTPALAIATAQVGLPAPDIVAAPAILKRAARNLAFRVLPATATVSAVRLGPLLIAAVPGEPVAAVGAGWRRALPAGTTIVSLADGYVGYVEEPDRVAARQGEAERTYYGEGLATTLGAAVQAAAAAIVPPRN